MVPLGRRRSLTLVGAGELVLKGQDRTLNLAVRVASTAAAAVEAAGGGDAAGGGAGCAGVKRRGHAGWGGGLWGANKVACAAAAGVDVGVLCHGRVWLGDGVAGHIFFLVVFLFIGGVECGVYAVYVVARTEKKTVLLSLRRFSSTILSSLI